MVMEANDKYVQRLFGEWKQHGKIILALDYDNTLSHYVSPYHPIDNVDDMGRAIGSVKDAQMVGTYNMIHTSCDANRHQEIREYCDSIGIVVDTINKTPIDVPFGKEGSKPFFNISLDDRCGLRESIEILEMATVLMRSHLLGKKLDNPGSTEF